MKLKTILSECKRFEHLGLEDAIGDGYLLKHNSVFKKSRKDVLALGYKYTSTDDSYFHAPLLALNGIYQKKRIPYRKNISPVLALEKSRPDFYDISHLGEMFPEKNTCLHEQGHCFVFSSLFKNYKDFESRDRDSRLILLVTLGEAFASSCEILAQVVSKNKVELFLTRRNIIYAIEDAKIGRMKELLDMFGTQSVCKMLILGFIFSNTLYESLGEEEMSEFLELCEIKTKSAKRLELVQNFLSDIVFTMSPVFRLLTQRLYLTTIGYDLNVLEHYNFDPAALLLDDKKLLSEFNFFSKKLKETLGARFK